MRLVVLLVPLLAALPLLAPVQAGPAPATVVAVAFSFAPPILFVDAGTTVVWQGAALPHTVTTASSLDAALDGQGNDEANTDLNPDTFSRSLPQGSSLSHTFNTTGEYNYHCELHFPFGMVGRIVVE